jgi:hypothetical protein
LDVFDLACGEKVINELSTELPSLDESKEELEDGSSSSSSSLPCRINRNEHEESNQNWVIDVD